jgi:hypothetical protein
VENIALDMDRNEEPVMPDERSRQTLIALASNWKTPVRPAHLHPRL